MSTPIIPTQWTLAMLICGGIGLLVHIGFTIAAIIYYKSTKLDSANSKIFIITCILVFIFNGFACFEWLFLRTNIIFTLNRTLCSAIYSSNFMFYFIAKYCLHCVYIYRIFVTFEGSEFAMKPCHLHTFLIMTTVNFSISIGFWIYNVIPSVLEGNWYFNRSVFAICTLFSEDASNTFTVKAAAVSIGLQDFIIGSISLYVFLKRFHSISEKVADDPQLLSISIKFAVVASFSVISTLFLFTLAVPFYPNVTFILAIDATINSICLFCMLNIGERVYIYLFYPCYRCGDHFIVKRFTNHSKQVNHIECGMQTAENDIDANKKVNKRTETKNDVNNAATFPISFGETQPHSLPTVAHSIMEKKLKLSKTNSL